jgi:hypothetical protein
MIKVHPQRYFSIGVGLNINSRVLDFEVLLIQGGDINGFGGFGGVGVDDFFLYKLAVVALDVVVDFAVSGFERGGVVADCVVQGLV